jgi:cbb3-type cytochrome oxidase subunit 3
MQLAIFLIVVGTVWLIFRKSIARYQLAIISEVLRAGHDSDEERVNALKQLGTMFAVLLLLAGIAIVILNLFAAG